MIKSSFSQGDGNWHKTERLILQFQGIRSSNSLNILCWTYYKTDNSLRSDNQLYNIAQNFQRKELLMPFHRRIRSFYFMQIACAPIDVRLCLFNNKVICYTSYLDNIDVRVCLFNNKVICYTSYLDNIDVRLCLFNNRLCHNIWLKNDMILAGHKMLC
jgi:hypothetical protein